MVSMDGRCGIGVCQWDLSRWFSPLHMDAVLKEHAIISLRIVREPTNVRKNTRIFRVEESYAFLNAKGVK